VTAPGAIEPLCGILELLAARAWPGTRSGRGGLAWRLHPLQLLLGLHDCVPHAGGMSAGAGAPCCAAARRALNGFERACGALAPALRGSQQAPASGALIGELCSGGCQRGAV
jgi:hypothetical protein